MATMKKPPNGLYFSIANMLVTEKNGLPPTDPDEAAQNDGPLNPRDDIKILEKSGESNY